MRVAQPSCSRAARPLLWAMRMTRHDETLADLLARARALAADVERYAHEHTEASLSLRLACAHALGTVDQLEEVLRTTPHGVRAA